MVVTVRTAKKIRMFFITANVLLFILITFLYYLNIEIKTDRIIHIQQGSINKILFHLKEKGYDISRLDSFLLRIMGLPQKGWIDLKSDHLKKADFLYSLTFSKAAMTDITLIPGETAIIALEVIAEQLGLNSEILWETYKISSPFTDGYLVPETYKVPIGIQEKELIELLINRGTEFHTAMSNKIFGSYNYKKWLHFVTLASIIQKEAANKDEMPLVSSVIYNRLKKRMKLQMDGSLNYGKYSHVKITPKRIKEDTSKYNTYRYYGLPKQPVCMVEKEAILAAVYPEKTDYLYFMKNKSGTHDFTKNYNTHLKNIKRATKKVTE